MSICLMSSHPFNGRRVSKAADAEDIKAEDIAEETPKVAVRPVAEAEVEAAVGGAAGGGGGERGGGGGGGGGGGAVEWPIDASLKNNDNSPSESGLCVVSTVSVTSFDKLLWNASTCVGSTFTANAVSFDNLSLISATMLLNNNKFCCGIDDAA